MKVLLTGGSGNLGQTSGSFRQRVSGDEVARLRAGRHDHRRDQPARPWSRQALTPIEERCIGTVPLNEFGGVFARPGARTFKAFPPTWQVMVSALPALILRALSRARTLPVQPREDAPARIAPPSSSAPVHHSYGDGQTVRQGLRAR